MQLTITLALALSLFAFWSSQDLEARVPEAAIQPRQTQSLDGQWLFAKGEQEGSEDPDRDDSDWRPLSLPHDWSIEGPFDQQNPAAGEGGFLPTGVGWYRKHFSIPAASQGRRLFVEFDGVMANSDVWVNGQHLGHRPNGYASFRYEITDHVHYGKSKENVLAVRADTSAQVASRWYTGSGIYRHVRLVTVDPLHVDYHGVFVTTGEVDKHKAVIDCRVTIRNQGSDASDVTLHTVIVNPAGKEVATSTSTVRVMADSVAEITRGDPINHPQLWDIDHPALYRVVHRVSSEGKVTDQVSTPFGIRAAEFRADTGFWLNGRNLKLKGVCLHHTCGALGAAVPLGAWEYQLQGLHEMGVNAIRTAHNPVAPEFLDLCDKMGFLVMDELFDCWTVGKRKQDYHLYFDEWSHRDARDTIVRDRNHPSVILYSAGNEIHDTPRPELAKRVLQGLMEVFHQTDPTRPVTQGLFRPNVSHDYDNGLADMLDVIGTNYRDLELLEAWRDNPKRKIVGTEQGHDRRTWLSCRDHPQHAGQFLWVGIDYLGESRRWPVTTFDSGLLDRTGYPHPRGFERQSWWSDVPMVRVFRREAANPETPTDPGYEAVEWERRQVLFADWSPRRQDAHQESVEVYSNCGEVELLLNGESLGSKPLPVDGQSRNWKVDYSPGTFMAIARNDGQEVARHELRTAGAAHHLGLTSKRKTLAHNWDDVAYVEVQIEDEQGLLVPRAVDEVTFSVAGPGKIFAVDSGSIVSHESFQADRRRAHQGRCIAVVRATANSGEIVVTAESPGLKSGTLRLKVGDAGTAE